MKFKVVVVDDDEDTRDYITMALETWEHERFSFDIELADDALKALDILHNFCRHSHCRSQNANYAWRPNSSRVY